MSEPDATLEEAEQRVRTERGRGPSRSRVRVAEAMLDQGDALRELRRFDDALECYEGLRLELSGLDDPRARELDALALTAVAGVHVQQGRPEVALPLCDDVLDLVGDNSTVAFRQCEAFTRLQRSAALLALGRAVEAEEMADQLITVFEHDPVHGHKRTNVVAMGLQSKVAALITQKRLAEAGALAQDLISRYRGDPEVSVALVVARAKALRAVALAGAGDLDRAGKIRAELASEFAESGDSRFREVAARATARQASDLLSANRAEEALELAEHLFGALNERPLPDRPDASITAHLVKARALRVLDRTEAARDALRDLMSLTKLETSRRPTRKRLVAEVVRVASQLAQSGHPSDALRFLDESLSALEKITSSDPELFAALLSLRPLLVRDASTSPEPVVVACDAVIKTLANHGELPARRAVAAARRQKAVSLGTLRRTGAASSACDELIAEHGADEDPQIRADVAAGLAYKASLQEQRGRRRAALKTLGKLTEHCGDEPAEGLERWAREAHRRSAVLRTGLSDRRRLRLASAVPAILAVTGIALQLIKRRLGGRPARQ